MPLLSAPSTAVCRECSIIPIIIIFFIPNIRLSLNTYSVLGRMFVTLYVFALIHIKVALWYNHHYCHSIGEVTHLSTDTQATCEASKFRPTCCWILRQNTPTADTFCCNSPCILLFCPQQHNSSRVRILICPDLLFLIEYTH